MVGWVVTEVTANLHDVNFILIHLIKSKLKTPLVLRSYIHLICPGSGSKILCSPATMLRPRASLLSIALAAAELFLLSMTQDEAVMACLELIMAAVQRKESPLFHTLASQGN